MIMMKRSELDSLLKDAVATGIKQCINEGIIIGMTPKYKQKLKSVKDATQYYTIKDLCELWNICPSTVWRYEQRNIITGIRLANNGGKVLFDKSVIDSMTPPRYTHEETQEDLDLKDMIMFDVDSEYLND